MKEAINKAKEIGRAKGRMEGILVGKREIVEKICEHVERDDIKGLLESVERWRHDYLKYDNVQLTDSE